MYFQPGTEALCAVAELESVGTGVCLQGRGDISQERSHLHKLLSLLVLAVLSSDLTRQASLSKDLGIVILKLVVQ